MPDHYPGEYRPGFVPKFVLCEMAIDFTDAINLRRFGRMSKELAVWAENGQLNSITLYAGSRIPHCVQTHGHSILVSLIRDGTLAPECRNAKLLDNPVRYLRVLAQSQRYGGGALSRTDKKLVFETGVTAISAKLGFKFQFSPDDINSDAFLNRLSRIWG